MSVAYAFCKRCNPLAECTKGDLFILDIDNIINTLIDLGEWVGCLEHAVLAPSCSDNLCCRTE